MSTDYRDLKYRPPYVGEGIDGTLRSIEIDRTEIDDLPRPGQPGWGEQVEAHRTRLESSIETWRLQAQILAGAVHGMSPHQAPQWALWNRKAVGGAREYAVVRLDEGHQGCVVGCGPTSLATAQEDARAWLDGGVPVRVVGRLQAPAWTAVVS